MKTTYPLCSQVSAVSQGGCWSHLAMAPVAALWDGPSPLAPLPAPSTPQCPRYTQ